jgi:hypothetical protein
MTEDTILDIDKLMDENLDSVEDVPDYNTPPNGNYTLAVADATLTASKKEGKPGQFSITLQVKETKELANASELPVADETLFSIRYQATEQGVKYFKKAAKDILNVSSLEGVSVRDILASLKDAPAFTAVVTTTVTTDGEGDSKKTYTNTRVRPVQVK